MAMYSIEDKTLTALGDAVRNKLNVEPYVKPDTFKLNYGLGYNGVNSTESFSLKGASKIKAIIDIVWDKGSLLGNPVCVAPGIFENNRFIPDASAIITLNEDTQFPITVIVDGKDISFGITQGNGFRTANVSIELFALDISGNDYFLNPLEMANTINNLMALGENNFIFTGDLKYISYGGNWDWYFSSFFNKIKINNVSSLQYSFYGSKLTDYPEIYWGTSSGSISNSFSKTPITNVPAIIGGKFSAMGNMFDTCEYLVHLPDDFWIDCEFSQSGPISGMFTYCYRLRNLPIGFINRATENQSNYNNALYNLANGCYALDEIIGLKPSTATFTSNGCNNAIKNTYHLKDFIFAMNEDGTPLIRQWKSQTLDFSSYVGYGSLGTKYGFTEDTQITNDENYQSLKDNPDAWTDNYVYSRYNHDSAVRTINSLPDTSAYGTNNIKFQGLAGSATDGGAINTLTPEEIAVATSKGWTVSFV